MRAYCWLAWRLEADARSIDCIPCHRINSAVAREDCRAAGPSQQHIQDAHMATPILPTSTRWDEKVVVMEGSNGGTFVVHIVTSGLGPAWGTELL